MTTPARAFRVAALLGAAFVAARDASAAPQVAFTASRVDRCVAPCAVFFDATATTDATTERPFLDLDFQWEFGDERGEVWAVSGKPKNRAIGGIAGHLFTQPGAYTVTLRVANARGERATKQATIAVDDSAKLRTTCVSASGAFDGCPDGAERVTSRSFASAVANAPGRRTLFRRGETFAFGGGLRLADASERGAAIGAFGPGDARAVVEAAAGAMIDPGNDWRIADLELRGAGTRALAAITEHDGVRRLTLANLAVRGFDACLELWSPAQPNEQFAAIDLSCGGFPDPGSGAKLYEDTRESMFLGVTIDKGDPQDPRDQTEFAYRTVFAQKKLIQHGRFAGRGANQSKNLLQIRHCSANGPWRERCPDGRQPSRYVLVSDNHFLEGAGPRAQTIVRVCDHAACTGKPGESQPVSDYVFERNLFQIDPRSAPGDTLTSVFQIQAARSTVRDNVADLQGWPGGGSPRAFFAMVDALSNPRDASGEVAIEHNTLYLGPGFAKSIVLCAERGGPPKLACTNNLVYAPGLAGDVAPSMGAWRDAGNRVATSNPFRADPPARGKAALRDLARFSLGSARPAAGAAIAGE